MTFPLHQQAILDATNLELSSWVSAAVAECRRRALLNTTYDRNAQSIINNIEKNAKVLAAAAAAPKTPVLDALRARLGVK